MRLAGLPARAAADDKAWETLVMNDSHHVHYCTVECRGWFWVALGPEGGGVNCRKWCWELVGISGGAGSC